MGKQHRRQTLIHLKRFIRSIGKTEWICAVEIIVAITCYLALMIGPKPPLGVVDIAIFASVGLIIFNIGLRVGLDHNTRSIGMIFVSIIVLGLGIFVMSSFRSVLDTYNQSLDVCESWQKINLQDVQAGNPISYLNHQTQDDINNGQHIHQVTTDCKNNAKNTYDDSWLGIIWR